mgnify:CR=1 FL=1|tara:strand:- start:609 stop:1037 length:429 start_codon:yes stop_codon:yes gene_type:complete
MSILDPMLAMMAWSGLIVAILLMTRIPVVIKQWGNLQFAKHSDELRPKMSEKFRYVTDNYNHIFEQPTLFYAVLIYIHLADTATQTNISLAWAYVSLRVIHSVIQLTSNNVSWRAASFATSSLILIGMISMEVLAANLGLTG